MFVLARSQFFDHISRNLKRPFKFSCIPCFRSIENSSIQQYDYELMKKQLRITLQIHTLVKLLGISYHKQIYFLIQFLHNFIYVITPAHKCQINITELIKSKCKQ